MASAPDTLGVYPLSTLDGRHIPMDIVRPLRVYRQDFNDSGGSLVTLPDEAQIVILFATRPCLVKFGGVISMPANNNYGEDITVLPAFTFKTIDLNGRNSFSSIGMTVEGTLFVEYIQKWQDMRKNTQFNRN